MSSGGDAIEAESSETTLEISIRTLDSASHTIRVSKDISVPALKEQLQSVVGVPAQEQRLIFRGRVLKDDQLLSAYNVENGHTLHLVPRRRSPESQGGQPNEAAQADPAQQGRNSQQVTTSLLVGTINVPIAGGDIGMPDFNRILSAVLGSVGGAQVPNASTAGTGHAEGQQGAMPTAQRIALSMGGNQAPPRPFEVSTDALTTLSLYISRMEQMFYNAGLVGTLPQMSAPPPAPPVDPAAAAASIPNRPLMTPAALGGVFRRVLALLNGQAAVVLGGLAGQFENEASLTDVTMRGEVQAAAVWNGTVLQQLGALLMELGRTTLTLHMGSTPSEALVNSGPAVFISPNGPNPIMVQPMPFQPLGSLSARAPQLPNAWPGVQGPRSLNIHIHTSDVGVTPATNAPPPPQGSQQEQAPMTTASTGETMGDGNSQTLPGTVMQETIMVIQENNGDARVLSSRSRTETDLQPQPAAAEGTANSNASTQAASSTAQMAQQALNLLWPNLRPHNMQEPLSSLLGSMGSSNQVNQGQAPVYLSMQMNPPWNHQAQEGQAQQATTAGFSSPQPSVSPQASMNPSQQQSVRSPNPTLPDQSKEAVPATEPLPEVPSQVPERTSTSQTNPPAGLGLGRLRPLVPRRRPQENLNGSSSRADSSGRRSSAAPQLDGQNNMLTNIMGQIMKSPALETMAQQVMQNMGDTPSGGGGDGNSMQNLDLRSVLQQALPMVSEFLASGGVQRSQQLATTDSSDNTAVQNNTEVANESSGTQEVESALQKLESGDSAEEVISSVARAAMENARITLSESELAELICGLSDDYMAMVLQDLNSRAG